MWHQKNGDARLHAMQHLVPEAADPASPKQRLCDWRVLKAAGGSEPADSASSAAVCLQQLPAKARK